MVLLEIPTEEDIRSSLCISPEVQAAGDAAATSEIVHFCSGTTELVLVEAAAASRWILSFEASGLKVSDKWHDDVLGEKNGDWLAEKKAEDDEDIFLKLIAAKGPKVEELSSWTSILAVANNLTPN